MTMTTGKLKLLFVPFALLVIGMLTFHVAHAQQSNPLSSGDASALQLTGQGAAAFYQAIGNAAAAVLNLQAKATVDEAAIAALQTKLTADEAAIASMKITESLLQAQINLVPKTVPVGCTLVAGTCAITYSVMAVAPKCAISGTTTGPTLAITIPTTTGFTVNSSLPSDTQFISGVCR